MATVTHVLRARYVFPVSGPPIEDGIVTISGERIAAVGRGESRAPARDLGNVAILPGLVNAHTHLEFSRLRQPLGSPDMGFSAWVRQVVEYRRQHAEETPQAIAEGMRESRLFGTTTLGEVVTSGWVPQGNPIPDATLFLEMIALTSDRVDERLTAASAHLAARWTPAHARPGLSPHAPYSVHPRLLNGLVRLARQHNCPLAMHLAESREEIQLLRERRGPLLKMLEEMGARSSELIPGDDGPLGYLRVLAAAPRSLVIHGNYLADEEIQFLADCRDRMSVVYCPRTHYFFGHEVYPLQTMLKRGVRTALGTDSRASNPDLGLLAELRFAAKAHPQVPPQRILEMGTAEGARALGVAREVGTLTAGKHANLAVVALPDHTTEDPHRLIFDSDGPVVETWWHGERVEH